MFTALLVFGSNPDYMVAWDERLWISGLKNIWKIHEHYLMIHEEKTIAHLWLCHQNNSWYMCGPCHWLTVITCRLLSVRKVSKSKCWPFVNEDDSSIDTLHYKQGVSDRKCEDCMMSRQHSHFLYLILFRLQCKISCNTVSFEVQESEKSSEAMSAQTSNLSIFYIHFSWT